MRLKLRLPGGTLKIKTYRNLRREEREGKVPVLRVGGVYVVWWNLKPANG